MGNFLRCISKEEAAVLKRTLEIGASEEIALELFASIENLHVTATCSCGCKTVWFGPKGEASTGKILAEAKCNSGGSSIDIIVWLDQGAIVGLEFVCYELGTMELPSPGEIRSHAA
jgi:hypothetical protein